MPPVISRPRTENGRAMGARAGFTLAEIIVALLLSTAVATAAITAITNSQRITRAQMARVDAAQSARAVAYYLASVIRELDAREGDITVAGTTGMTYRASRWVGITCTGVSVSGLDLTVRIKDTQTFGSRAPSATLDSVFVFNENTPSTRSDDVWLVASLSAVAPSTCADGTGATELTIRVNAASGGNAAATAGFTSGSPLRGFQYERVGIYNDGTSNWLSQETMASDGSWSAVSAIAGPLQSSGLAFVYRDTTTAVTATLANIALVQMTVRTQSVDRVRQNGQVTNLRDSVITRVALRNNPRF